MKEFKGSHFSADIMMLNVYWYSRYSLSYGDLEEMARDRGLAVDHSTLQRWVIKYNQW